MQRGADSYEVSVQVGLKSLLNFAKQYTEGKRTQEELDLVIDKIVSIICSDVTGMIQFQCIIPKHTDFKEVSKFNVKDVLQTEHGFMKFVQVLKRRVTEHNELSKEGKSTLTVRDYLALGTIQLYSMGRIYESRKLAKLLYDLEVIGGKYHDGTTAPIKPTTARRKPIRQPSNPCFV